MRQSVRQTSDPDPRGVQTMRPLQVWLPYSDPALTHPALRRDLDRAQELWKGESTVWLIPGLDEHARWENPRSPWFRELAVPTEATNRVDVFHISSDGFIFGATRCTRFPQRGIAGLLNDWLSVGRGAGENAILYGPPPPEVGFLLPEITNRGVTYKWTWRSLGTIGTLSRRVPDSADQSRRVELEWPPEGTQWPATVSPAAESTEHYGPLVRDDVADGEYSIPSLVSQRDPRFRSLFLLDLWPGMLRCLFPLGAGPDAIAAQGRMVAVMEESQSNPVAALAKAQALASGYLAEATVAERYLVWYPLLIQHGEEAVLQQIAFKLDCRFASLAEAVACEKVQELFSRPVTTRRAYGALGLFWALLLDQLEKGKGFSRCKRCGRVIQARPNKKYCGKDDELQCFRARRASDRRRERARRRTRG